MSYSEGLISLAVDLALVGEQFLALQEQYETYRDELLRNQKTNPALSQKID